MAGNRKHPYEFVDDPVDVGTDIGEWGCALMMSSAVLTLLTLLWLAGFFG